MKSNELIWLKLAVVVGLTATFVPAMFGVENSGDGWVDFVFKYQTLITGLFAVVAAFVTIRQMRESDRIAREIHNDQIKLTKRGDQLKVERFRAFLPSRLLANNRAIEGYIRALHENRDNASFNAWDIKRKIKFVAAVEKIQEINRLLNDVSISESSHLFSPEVYINLKFTKDITEDFCRIVPEKFVQQAHVFFGEPDGPPNWYWDRQDHIIGQFPSRIDHLAKITHKWALNEVSG